ncbi:hypothetical protein IID23_02235 [Patescibacteria group bacterium]|nr:hypothetical protein [Patescibacteria group bacterium]
MLRYLLKEKTNSSVRIETFRKANPPNTERLAAMNAANDVVQLIPDNNTIPIFALDWDGSALINNNFREYSRFRPKITIAINDVLNKKAIEKGYDSVLSLISYISDPVEDFQREADIFIAWRSACWTYAKSIGNDVGEAEGQPMPDLQGIIDNLPLYGTGYNA